MNILEVGIEKGRQEGIEKGRKEGIEAGRKDGIEEGCLQTLVRNVEAAMKNLNADQHRACEILGVSVDKYEYAKLKIASREK